jgi:hypothetical protein
MKQLVIEAHKSVRAISEAMRNAQLCGTCRTAFAVERRTCRDCLDGLQPAPESGVLGSTPHGAAAE